MPTINDIAKRAGVSHGTVSNVLNKRGNVRSDKIRRVEKAARELGFTLNAQARQLRQGHSRRVAIIVPKVNIRRYNDICRGLSYGLSDSDILMDMYATDDTVYKEAALLQQIASTNPIAIVLVSASVRNTLTIDVPTTMIIHVEREVEGITDQTSFFGFDYFRAGSELSSACKRDGHTRVAVFSGAPRFSHNREFIRGCNTVFDTAPISVDYFSVDEAMSLNTAFSIVHSTETYHAIISIDSEQVEYLKTAYAYHPEKQLSALYAVTSSDMTLSKDITRYQMDYQYCGMVIADTILEASQSGQEDSRSSRVREFGGGLVNPISPLGSGLDSSEGLRFLSLKSPTTEALRMLLPSFTQETGIRIELIELSYEELYKEVQHPLVKDACDVIRIDMAWLSAYGARIFRPLDLDRPPLNDICETFTKNLPIDYFRTQGVVYTLPFDVSAQLLFYRKDIFADAGISRKFFEQYRRPLQVPKNFDELLEVARFFTQTYNPDSPTRYGTSFVLGTPVVAACELLPRLKAYGGAVLDSHGRVKVMTPAFRQALENCKQTFLCTSQRNLLWWHEAVTEFSRGESAMNMVFYNHASTMMQGQQSELLGKIGVSTMPGSQPLLGGGVLGIARGTHRVEDAERFIQWIFQKQTAQMITYLGGYINHQSLTRSVDILELYPWIQGAEKALSLGWRRSSTENIRFDEYRFEEVIGSSIQAAVSGHLTIDQAMQEAQSRCDAIFN